MIGVTRGASPRLSASMAHRHTCSSTHRERLSACIPTVPQSRPTQGGGRRLNRPKTGPLLSQGLASERWCPGMEGVRGYTTTCCATTGWTKILAVRQLCAWRAIVMYLLTGSDMCLSENRRVWLTLRNTMAGLCVFVQTRRQWRWTTARSSRSIIKSPVVCAPNVPYYLRGGRCQSGLEAR